MKPILSPINPQIPTATKGKYISVKTKFWISHIASFIWMCFSIYVAQPWLEDLAKILSFPLALLIIGGISYIPGYMNSFLVISLILDRQPAFKNEYPND